MILAAVSHNGRGLATYLDGAGASLLSSSELTCVVIVASSTFRQSHNTAELFATSTDSVWNGQGNNFNMQMVYRGGGSAVTLSGFPPTPSATDQSAKEEHDYNATFVAEVLAADAAPPEASFNNVVDMLDWLNRER